MLNDLGGNQIGCNRMGIISVFIWKCPMRQCWLWRTVQRHRKFILCGFGESRYWNILSLERKDGELQRICILRLDSQFNSRMPQEELKKDCLLLTSVCWIYIVRIRTQSEGALEELVFIWDYLIFLVQFSWAVRSTETY